jgi:hypothetical protein
MTRFLTLATLACIGLGQTAAAESFTFTGSNGGVIEGQRDCLRAPGAVTCTASGTYTGPQGNSGLWDRTLQRHAADGVVTGSRTGTNTAPNGRVRAIDRSWTIRR